MTYGDRIRSMSDEELAAFIVRVKYQDGMRCSVTCPHQPICPGYGTECYEIMLKELKEQMPK